MPPEIAATPLNRPVLSAVQDTHKPQTTSRPARLDALTSLRFFFALMVVLGHFTGRLSAFGPFPGFVYQMAPLAVAWFFVLSGYIIAYNYPSLNTNEERGSFLALRVARLWPVHCAILTVGLLVRFYHINPPWLMFQYTMTQSWSLSPDIAGGYNGPAWSISDEFFFYIAYIGLAAPRRWLGVLVGLAIVGIGIIIPLSQGCVNGGTAQCNYWIFMFPPTRIIEFIGGVLLFHSKVRVPQIVGLAAAVAVFLSWVPIPNWNVPVNLAARELVTIAGAGFLIVSLTQDGWLSKILCLPFLVFLGEISYSVYMTHEVVHQVLLPRDGWGYVSTFMLTMSATLLLSTLLFYFVEAPSRNWVKSFLKQRARRA